MTRESKELASARAEAEAAQADLKSAVKNLGGAAGSVRGEATATAKRFAPVAIGIAGAIMVVSLLRRRR